MPKKQAGKEVTESVLPARVCVIQGAIDHEIEGCTDRSREKKRASADGRTREYDI
jgi:hypothetical protein